MMVKSQETKIWLFHKPVGLICTHKDPENRPTVFQRVKDLGLSMPHLISIVDDYLLSLIFVNLGPFRFNELRLTIAY